MYNILEQHLTCLCYFFFVDFRVSELAGAKLAAGNPNLVDISDENRPTKLAERYNELYDNDWTDAFDTLTAKGQTDEMVIKTLKDILMVVSIHFMF